MSDVVEKLYNKLVFYGYFPEEFQFNSSLSSLELITRVDGYVDLNIILPLLNNDEVWDNIVNHILKIDKEYLNLSDLNLIRKLLINNNLIIYSNSLGDNFVSSGLLLNKDLILDTDIVFLNEVLVSSGFMFLVCGYSFLYKYMNQSIS